MLIWVGANPEVSGLVPAHHQLTWSAGLQTNLALAWSQPGSTFKQTWLKAALSLPCEAPMVRVGSIQAQENQRCEISPHLAWF